VAITTIPGASGSDLTTLQGTELADSFVLTANSLNIDALEGADSVTAANAVDKITASAGAGGDSLTFSGAVSGSNFDLGEGNDTASFQDFAGSLIGGTGNDNIDVNRAAENSTLKGNAGNDLFAFDTTLSSSLVFGNADDDTITVTGATTGSTIFGGKQEDQITVAAVTNGLLRGDKGNDTITVTGDIDNVVIQGNADADQIIVSSSKVASSTIFGGQGADNLDISSGAILVRGDDGNDDIDLTGNAAYTVSGGAGNDAIDSTSTKAAKYFGGKGNDTITAATAVGSGNNVISGDAGNDSITGANDAEQIDGGAGKDTITGAGGKDTIFGKAGADSIDVSGGSAANLNVLGGADNDTIKLTDADLNSDDVIKGESGTDVLQFSDDAAGLADVQFKGVSGIETIDIDTINGTATFGSNAQTTGITKIDAAGVSASTFTIDASAFTSSVGLTITSTKADIDSTIKGGSGNDTINTGVDGEVVMTGGSGADLFVHTSDEVVSITDLGNGLDNFTVDAIAGTGVLTATASANYTAGTTTQNQGVLGQAVITGSGFDVNMGAVTTGTTGFVINGNATAATLQGSGLADSITGGSAADSIVGNNGDDVLVGGAQSDTIVAGAGNDTIKIAGTAQHQFAGDSINAGTGTDLISLANGTDTLTAEFDMDNITDVLNITTSGAGANTKDTTITFSVITETTTQTVTVNAASLTDTNGDLVVVNNSARATTTFSITGGAEGDSIVGGIGNDTINAAAGVDSITGAAGNDLINLSVDAEIDRVVLADTATNNGFDTITDFLQGATNDILNADAFKDFTAVNTTALAANPSATDVENDVNLLVDISGNEDITTASGLTTALATSGEYVNVNMANSKKALFITAASADAGETQHVFYATSDGSGVITAEKVAVLTGSLLDINLYDEDNFNKLS
jgi:Ca2+-binding RTX toxin-like protein